MQNGTAGLSVIIDLAEETEDCTVIPVADWPRAGPMACHDDARQWDGRAAVAMDSCARAFIDDAARRRLRCAMADVEAAAAGRMEGCKVEDGRVGFDGKPAEARSTSASVYGRCDIGYESGHPPGIGGETAIEPCCHCEPLVFETKRG